MPQSDGARGMPDLNFTPEDQGITEEPSNPQHGPSNPEEGMNSPEQHPPELAFFRARVLKHPPKPFFTGKIAGALEGMRKLLVKIRRRSKPKKEVRYVIRSMKLIVDYFPCSLNKMNE